MEPHNEANYRLYGKTLTATDIVRGTDVKPSTEGQSLVSAGQQANKVQQVRGGSSRGPRKASADNLI